MRKMKNNLNLLASAALILAASCTAPFMNEAITPDGPAGKETGTIEVRVVQDGPATRALSEYDAEKEYEMAINKLEVLVFDREDGSLHGYLDSGNSTSVTMTVTAGIKNVYVIVNSPSDLSRITDEQSLKDMRIMLDDNHLDNEKGFVMSGMAEVEVVAGKTATPTINVDRFTSRIALVKVTNELPPAYGALVIEDVFLSNVVGNWTLGGGPADEVEWYNVKGRIADAASSEQIVGVGNNAGACGALTHQIPKGLSVPNLSQGTDNSAVPNCLFYSYPNSCESAAETVEWDTDPFPGDKTRLVLTATVGGTYFYYPVVIDKLERNKSYDVSVKISGFGVSDPDGKIEKGSMQFTVQANEWTMGDAITGDL